MNSLMQLIQQHPTMFVLGLWWVASAAISAMPMPAENSGSGYKWFFAFAHTVAGSVARVIAMKYPQANGNGNGINNQAQGTGAGK